jgi:hypothetical protein
MQQLFAASFKSADQLVGTGELECRFFSFVGEFISILACVFFSNNIYSCAHIISLFLFESQFLMMWVIILVGPTLLLQSKWSLRCLWRSKAKVCLFFCELNLVQRDPS